MDRPTSQFGPVIDREHFPLIVTGGPLPVEDLVGCDALTFCWVEDTRRATAAMLSAGKPWHEYGDVRWPWEETWIEFDPTPAGFRAWTGVLIKRCPIPANLPAPYEWVATNSPLSWLFLDQRGEQEIKRYADALREAKLSTDVSGPGDEVPAHVQSYCIYRVDGDGRGVLEARYTDLLNVSGEIIPRYRTMVGEAADLDFRRFALHAVCAINSERRLGLGIVAQAQLTSFEPVPLAPGEEMPPWSRFHPMRCLRRRPDVRSVSIAGAMMHGAISVEAMERVTNAQRIEHNRSLLAFTREVRPRVSPQAELNEVLTAFVHKSQGAAIYSLPHSLTEEFLHTDCHEVNLLDLRLPFQHLYLSFNPPEPLMLGDGAEVDGCYVCKQPREELGDEGEILLVLTSRRKGVDYGRSLAVCSTDTTFSLRLPIADADVGYTVDEAVEIGIETFLEQNAPPEDDFSREISLPNGRVVKGLDVRAQSRARRVDTFIRQEPVFRTCLNVIFNALCFISFRPDDISEEWDREPPAWVIEALTDPRDTRSVRDRRFNANRLIASNDYTRIMVCGKKLFDSDRPSASVGNGVSPRAHWRRGHWRRQRYGTGLSQILLRWIRPTLVKAENGPPVEARIYDVQRKPMGEELNS